MLGIQKISFFSYYNERHLNDLMFDAVGVVQRGGAREAGEGEVDPGAAPGSQAGRNQWRRIHSSGLGKITKQMCNRNTSDYKNDFMQSLYIKD
jgi:hypothetical protein